MSISQESLEDFRLYLRKRGASDNTVISYLSAIRQYDQLFSELSAELLAQYRQYLICRYRPSTVNVRIHGINRYLAYLVFRKQTGFAPLEQYRIPVVRQQQQPFFDRVLSNQDYQIMKEGLLRDKNAFWYFILRFLGSTGARVSELIQIKAEHLTLGYMDLYSKGGKMRRIYFPDALCAECLEWIHARNITTGFIFLTSRGRIITPRGINSQLKVIAQRYGVEPEKVYPHAFRHLYAKNFLEKFNDLSLLADLLGHESIETTKIYTARTSAEQKALLDRIINW